MVGKHNTFSFKDLGSIRSLGKNKVNRRKARGVIADITKLIFPQNKIEGDCLKMYSMKTVNPQPAQAQARTDRLILTCVRAAVFM
jgi:hypothetical protein